MSICIRTCYCRLEKNVIVILHIALSSIKYFIVGTIFTNNSSKYKYRLTGKPFSNNMYNYSVLLK